MQAVTLTSPQQAQAAANKAAIVAARTALKNAVQAQEEYLQSAASASGKRVQLSDDGTMVIVG